MIKDQKRYVKLSKEYKDLRGVMDVAEEYISVFENQTEAKEIIANSSDAEMVEMAKMELDETKVRLPQLEEKLKVLMIPKIQKTLRM